MTRNYEMATQVERYLNEPLTNEIKIDSICTDNEDFNRNLYESRP